MDEAKRTYTSGQGLGSILYARAFHSRARLHRKLMLIRRLWIVWTLTVKDVPVEVHSKNEAYVSVSDIQLYIHFHL
jgi:hypothetical protein